MADYSELIEALEGSRRSFGREDLDKSFGEMLVDMDRMLNKRFDEVTREQNSLIKQLDKAINNGATQDVINALNDKITKLNDSADEIINKIQNNNSSTANSYAKEKALENLSGTAGYRIHNDGKSLKNVGKSLEKLGMSKIGGAFSKIGTQLIKKAGPIGIALTVLEKAVAGASFTLNKFGEYYQYKAEQQGFTNQMESTINQRQLGLTQTYGEQVQAEQQNIITKAQNEIRRFAELMVEGNGILTDAYASATEITLNSLTNISQGAFEATSKTLDIEASIDKFNKHIEISGAIVAAQNRLADTQLAVTEENIKRQNAEIRTQASTQLGMLNQKQMQSRENFFIKQVGDGLGVVPFFGDMLKSTTEAYGNMRKGGQAYQNALLEFSNIQAMHAVNIDKAQTSITGNLITAAENFNLMVTQTMGDTAKSFYDQERERELREQKAWLKFSQTVFNAFQKSETAAFEMGRAFNFNNDQLNSYAKNLSATQIVVSKWGKNLADMMKLQNDFQESTGRNRFFSESDFDKSFANGLLVGDSVVSQLNAGMEIFNVSVSDSNDMFYDMYKQVTKIGLNGKKYAKDLIKNLQLAEKYNFKGGVANLMQMSKWAQNTRFNVDSLDSMLNKVQEGGLEGIIKQSAELQVLGGNFAMGADPLAMAYESFMDPEAYAKRMNSMIAGQGMFNDRTGNIAFGAASQMIMRQYAQSTGQNYKDVLNQARQQVKIGQINRHLTQNFDDDQKAAIANNATYDKNTQSWVINTANGIKDVSQLTAEDVNGLSGPEDGEKTMQENIATMRSTELLMKATQDRIISIMQNSLWEKNREAALEMIKNVNGHFKDEFKTYKTTVFNFLDNVPEAQKSMIKMMEGGEDTTMTTIKQTISTLQTGLGQKITEASDAITEAIANIKFPDPHDDEGNENTEGLSAELKKVVTHMNTMGGFKVAESALKNENSSWYSGDMVSLMESLRKDSTKLKDVKDKELQKKLATLIFNWDDSGWTEDLDYHNDADLSKIYYDAVENKVFGNGGGGAIRLNPSKIHSDNIGLNGEGYSATRNISNGYYHDGVINKNGTGNKINDGLVIQNGVPTRIDSNDQVLAAKSGGPIDKMVSAFQSVMPRPMHYDSYVRESPNSNGGGQGNGNGKIEVAPIQININGSIQLSGANGTIDITQQIANDPNFIRSLSQMISLEVEKKVHGGRVNNVLDRGLQF